MYFSRSYSDTFYLYVFEIDSTSIFTPTYGDPYYACDSFTWSTALTINDITGSYADVALLTKDSLTSVPLPDEDKIPHITIDTYEGDENLF